MNRQVQGLIAINIAALIFGSAALYGRLNVSPFWIVSMRALFAGGTLVLIALLRKELKQPRAQLLSLIFTGIILSLHWLTFFYSVQLSGIAVSTLTFAAFPFFTLIMEAIKNKRKLKVIEVIASLMIVCSVGILTKVNTVTADFFVGAVLGLLSALLFALFGIVSKALTSALPALTVSFYQNAVACLVLLPFLPFTAPPQGSSDWLLLISLGVVTTALMHQLYFYALQRLSAGTCSGFVALEPVYAISFAALLFNEPISGIVIVSGIVILLASFLILKS